jgi:hypothetical protein
MIRDYTNEVEMLGTALLRSTVMPVLDQLVYKWAHSRYVSPWRSWRGLMDRFEFALFY